MQLDKYTLKPIYLLVATLVLFLFRASISQATFELFAVFVSVGCFMYVNDLLKEKFKLDERLRYTVYIAFFVFFLLLVRVTSK